MACGERKEFRVSWELRDYDFVISLNCPRAKQVNVGMKIASLSQDIPKANLLTSVTKHLTRHKKRG